MDQNNTLAVAAFRDTLLGMKPAGEHGFEGLMGAVLGLLTDLSYSLASSGPQAGSDGDAKRRGERVSFECKRYTDAPPNGELTSKIAELGPRNDVDLWIVCATAPVRSQSRRVIEAASTPYGLEVVILDWDDAQTLPQLAVAIASVPPNALRAQLVAMDLATSAADAIIAGCDALRARPGFDAAGTEVRKSVDLPTLAYASALAANKARLDTLLANRREATARMGQPLAPADESINIVLPRQALTDRILEFIESAAPAGPLALTGDEGVGKSWAPAKAWLTRRQDIMLLVVPAENLDGAVFPPTDELVAACLARQVDDVSATSSPERWRRKVTRWLEAGAALANPLVLVIDGINQRPDLDWPRLFDRLIADLGNKGMRLIFSTRTNHFIAKIRDRLDRPAVMVRVDPWTPAERDEILRGRQVNPALLSEDVADILVNPRLLSVALRLLGNDELANLQELSAARLLFEHIRILAKENKDQSPHDFAQGLAARAREILARHERNELEDLHVFEDTKAVSQTRFFRPVDGSPTLFRLEGDGLTMALAVALIEDVKKKKRNNVDVQVATNELLDPLSALDATAGILLAAITVACITEEDLAIARALLLQFTGLQNIPEKHRLPFLALARKRPDAYLAALRAAVLDESPHFNRTWLLAALKALSAAEPAWKNVSDGLKTWLHLFCRDAMAPRRPDQDDAAWTASVREYRDKVDQAIAVLTADERARFDTLEAVTTNPAPLAGVAFELLAGKPLAPFVEALCAWRFGTSINRAFMAPTVELMWLGELNPADWAEAQAEARRLAALLMVPGASDAALRTASNMLLFTGDASDAHTANAARALMQEKQALVHFTTVSDTSNPLDPDDVPASTSKAVDEFERLLPSSLHSAFVQTREDLDFDRSLPVVARWRPEVATAKGSAYIDDVLSRSGLPLRQGLLHLSKVAPLINERQARALLAIRAGFRTSDAVGIEPIELATLSMFSLRYAFFALGGDEQLQALMTDAVDESILFSVLPMLKSASAASVERALTDVVAGADLCRRQYLLTFLAHSQSPLTSASQLLLSAMLDDAEPGLAYVRAHYLAFAGTDAELGAFARAWPAKERTDDAEDRFGSLAVVRAIGRGLVAAGEVIDTLHPTAMEPLALLGGDAAAAVASQVDRLLCNLSAPLPEPTFGLEADVDLVPDHLPRLLRTRALSADEETEHLQSFLSPDAKAQNRAQEKRRLAYRELRDAFGQHHALLLVDDLSPVAFAKVAANRPLLVGNWAARLLTVSGQNERWLYNIAQMVAIAESFTNPASALALLAAYADVEPAVRMAFGWNKISLAAFATWSMATGEAFDNARRARLHGARDDHTIAVEVVAACLCGKEAFVSDFADDCINAPHPATQALGWMLIGLLPRSEGQVRRAGKGADPGSGLPGLAAMAAFAAARKNTWAQHWFGQMMHAPDGASYWCSEALFLQCVDVRVDLWARLPDDATEVVRRYWPVTASALSNRLAKAADGQRRMWLGQTRPRDAYLPA